MLRLASRFPGKSECLLGFCKKEGGIGGITQLGLRHPMNERVRLEAIGGDFHLITGQASRARADKGVEHPDLAGRSPAQQRFHPFSRKARAVTEPPVNRQPQVIEKIGRVTDNLKIRASPLRLDRLVEQIKDGLPIVLTQANQHAVAVLRMRVFWRCGHLPSHLTGFISLAHAFSRHAAPAVI